MSVSLDDEDDFEFNLQQGYRPLLICFAQDLDKSLSEDGQTDGPINETPKNKHASKCKT